jgi:hypothetical protein
MYTLEEAWRVSGMTRKKFAGQHSLTDVSFAYWCKKYPAGTVIQDRPAALPPFVELSLDHGTRGQQREPHVELEFPGGLRLKIYA